MSAAGSARVPASIEHVVNVEVLHGARADKSAPPQFLVEVPHGADRRSDYDALRARLTGDLPDDLHEFFHLNTDVGAWAYGRATAEALVAAREDLSVVILRCLIPRTFVDCNRPAQFEGTDLDKGGLTAGIPSYVHGDADRALLLDLHRTYVAAARAAFAAVCGAGGLALLPHTYGPRSLGIEAVDEDIVKNLRVACAPDKHDTWPLRAEVDVLTRDGEGIVLSPHGIEEQLLAAFGAAGFSAVANDTYYLHPSSLGFEWSATYAQQVTSLEVRRDLLVAQWTPLQEMVAVDEKVRRVADALAPVLLDALSK